MVAAPLEVPSQPPPPPPDSVPSFASHSQQGSQNGGAVIFGGVDNSLYKGQIFWAPVTQELYWQIGVEE